MQMAQHAYGTLTVPTSSLSTLVTAGRSTLSPSILMSLLPALGQVTPQHMSGAVLLVFLGSGTAQSWRKWYSFCNLCVCVCWGGEDLLICMTLYQIRHAVIQVAVYVATLYQK